MLSENSHIEIKAGKNYKKLNKTRDSGMMRRA